MTEKQTGKAEEAARIWNELKEADAEVLENLFGLMMYERQKINLSYQLETQPEARAVHVVFDQPLYRLTLHTDDVKVLVDKLREARRRCLAINNFTGRSCRGS